jgi:hypothetical protein
MVRSTVDIAADIAAFQPTNGHWLGLDALFTASKLCLTTSLKS